VTATLAKFLSGQGFIAAIGSYEKRPLRETSYASGKQGNLAQFENDLVGYIFTQASE